MPKLDKMTCIEFLNVGNAGFVTDLWKELNDYFGNKINVPAFDVGFEDWGPVIEYNSNEVTKDELLEYLKEKLKEYRPDAKIGFISDVFI